MARLVGLDGPAIHAASLRRREGLHLVDVTMDLTKLRQYYTPTDLRESVLSAQRTLGERLCDGDDPDKGSTE